MSAASPIPPGSFLIDVQLASMEISPGGALDVTCSYTASSDEDIIQLTHSEGFTLHPTELPVSRGVGKLVRANVLVTRTDASKTSLRLTFTLGNSSEPKIVRVRP